MIRKLKSGGYRLYSRKVDPKTGKRRNLGTFKTRAAAERHGFSKNGPPAERESRHQYDKGDQQRCISNNRDADEIHFAR